MTVSSLVSGTTAAAAAARLMLLLALEREYEKTMHGVAATTEPPDTRVSGDEDAADRFLLPDREDDGDDEEIEDGSER